VEAIRNMAQQKQSTSSRIVARLRDISKGTPAPFGFVGRAQARSVPAMLLLASLSKNDPELVTAAIEAGADAVLGHLHLGEQTPAPSGEDAAKSDAPTLVEDAPSDGPGDAALALAPTEASPPDGAPHADEAPGPAAETEDLYFGGMDEERDHLAEMLRAADGHPLGIVVGANGDLTAAELEEMAKMGVDFVAVYPHRAPAALLSMETLGHVARLDPGYPGGPARGLADLELDAFAVSSGRPRDSLEGFTVHDMASFRQLLDTLNRPVMIASSWEITPEDLKFFREQGVEALILTPHVLGDTAESVGTKVAEFQRAISALGPPLGRGRSQEGRRVILPRVQPAGEPPELDDDDDDDDDDE
jgi:methylmalonyl-CoA mutase cobalamin-binding subunit